MASVTFYQDRTHSELTDRTSGFQMTLFTPPPPSSLRYARVPNPDTKTALVFDHQMETLCSLEFDDKDLRSLAAFFQGMATALTARANAMGVPK